LSGAFQPRTDLLRVKGEAQIRLSVLKLHASLLATHQGHPQGSGYASTVLRIKAYAASLPVVGWRIQSHQHAKESLKK
jgi:hypothetical protein